MVAAQEAAREQAELLAAVERNPGVRGLAANPLLLTILALMKRQGITLPERRVELYQKYIETLLKNWNLARGLDRPASRDLDVVETVRVLAPLALWMHETSPGVGLVKREEMYRQLEKICAGRNLPQPDQAARQFLADARDYAGLLLERGAGEYGFIHLTFQEYLAAVAIAQQGQLAIDSITATLAAHISEDTWREVTMLTIGHIGLIQQLDHVAGAVVRALIKRSPGEPGQAIVRAGEAVVDAWPGGVDPQSKERVVQVLAKTMIAGRHVKPTLRAAASAILAKLGDPRPGVALSPTPLPQGEGPGERAIPDLHFCYIPAGPFWMGSPDEDEIAYDNEKPLHQVDLPYDYWLSRYPVTVAQFRAFVEDGGYREPRYWVEAQANGDWREGKVIRRLYRFEGDELKVIDVEEAEAPYDFGEPYNLPNHPVVGITWYEALAFCRWLEEQLAVSRQQLARQEGMVVLGDLLAKQGYRLTLPSEAEWEKAARGTDKRRYPWGDRADPNRANYEDTGIGATSAVGCFPSGASSYGCEDMSGNVWEWTRTLWGKDWQKLDFTYPYNPADGREDLVASTNVLRVLRGGAFFNNVWAARCVYRNRYDPHFRNSYSGFRVAVVGMAAS